jgi:xylulokinase
VIGSSSEEHHPFVSPQPGWAEQNPEDWWRACSISVRKVLECSKTRGDAIACVGLSGQMHGAVLLDSSHEVIRPAIIWCDQRSEAQCTELSELLGSDTLIHLTCNRPLTNFTLTKLLWVRKNEPANWDRIRHLLLPKDYVRFRLTGEQATDVADASGTLLLDVANRCWAEEVLARTDTDPRFLPILYESEQICSRVSARGSEATGLPIGTPVVAGAGDQAAGALGMGITKPGSVSVTIGTSGVVFAATDYPAVDAKGRLHTFCHAIPRRWHVMGVTQAAGMSLRWFRDQFTGKEFKYGEGYQLLAKEAGSVPAGSNGLFWLPYLMGERTPHLDPKARAALLGLRTSHGRPHVVRAIMEGVAFSLKDTFMILDEMKIPVDSVRLGGGGTRSTLWRQIQADVYGYEVEILETEEGAAYGSALLAGTGAGAWASVDEACEKLIRRVSKVTPNTIDSATMQKAYSVYRKIYPALHRLFN